MYKHFAVAFAGFAVSSVASPALAGPEWVEFGDAGSLLGSAQKTIGEGQLTSISGNLGFPDGFAGGSDFEDLYLFKVVTPTLFSMQVAADFDAQLFLFNVTIPGEAFGLLGNDNTAGGSDPAFGNMATDGTGALVSLPGIYLVGISGAGRNPVSLNGNIFNFASSTEVSGADGPGGINPLNGWAGSGAVGSYTINLTASSFYDVPAPGAAALLAVAGLFSGRRRRE